MNRSMLLGQRFGRLLVTLLDERRAINGERYWKCICQCGNICLVTTSNLRRGNVRSCACLQREANTTHGRSHSAEYKTWEAMRRRCMKPKDKNFHSYGGRGITVCERWQKFEHFFTDMGEKPTPKHSIDRIDNEGPYSPDNCRWATQQEQCQNRRGNLYLTYEDRRQTITEWARESGLKIGTLFWRIHRGWSIERSLKTPIGKVLRRSKREEHCVICGIAFPLTATEAYSRKKTCSRSCLGQLISRNAKERLHIHKKVGDAL